MKRSQVQVLVAPLGFLDGNGSPLFPDVFIPQLGALAQLVERLLCKQEVRGSIPLGSTPSSSILIYPMKWVRLSGGTKSDPWLLTTAPGSSRYTMYVEGDELVCQVGSPTLT